MNANKNRHILLSDILANPEKTLAFQAPDRQRVGHLGAGSIQDDASGRARRNGGFKGSAVVWDLAMKSESGKLQVVGLTEPQEKLQNVKR